MRILIRTSLRTAPNDTEEQVCDTSHDITMSLTRKNSEQTKRHREISRIAFAGERVPKYGPAILVPQYCGKWIVRTSANVTWSLHSPMALGFKPSFGGMEKRPNE